MRKRLSERRTPYNPLRIQNIKQMKKNIFIYGLMAVVAIATFSGCSENETVVDDINNNNPNIIHIGGIDCDVLTTSLAGYTTRAAGDNEIPVDAETVDWLLGPLFGGLDITYGLMGKESTTQSVAILKLLKKDGATGETKDDIKYSRYTGTNGEKIAEYSFKYRTGKENEGQEGAEAIWYDNGQHYFQGVFVPEKLRYNGNTGSTETVETVNASSSKAHNLLFDQSKEGTDDNYTLLARYLGMPADASIHATVGRVKLPFRHRLARVIAYVLIDPTMGNDVTIQGYNLVNGKDDAATSEIKFCNVDILAGVEEKDDATGHATLTPRWDTSRKVIPHFVEERASMNSSEEVVNETNFIMFYDTEEKEYIFPADDAKWVDANDKWNAAYTAALSKYPDGDQRRESKAAEDADKSSKLKRTKYGKVPVYDLIVRPTYKTEDMVMYDEDLTGTSKENLVTLKNNIDFEITLSNGLQYEKNFTFDLDANYQTIVYLRISRESIDYNSSGADKWEDITKDDGFYGVNNQNGNTLSFAGSSWQRAYRLSSHFSQPDNVTDGHWYTKEDGTDDGVDDAMPNYQQYVSQSKWLEMFAEAHEGGKHHGDYFILDSDITIDAKLLPADFVFTGHLDGQDHTITLTGMGEKVVDEAEWYEDHYVGATSVDYSETLYVLNGINYDVFSIPNPLYVLIPATYYEEGDDIPEGKKVGDVKEQEHYDVSNPASVSVLMSGNYYIKNSDDTYSPYKPTLYVNKPIHHPEISHTSGSTLFAGLNGAYAAAIGVANVHEENGILVPYVDKDSKTGWRAEVINTKISGADMFPADVIKADGTYDVTKVSGYIYNCWKIADDNRAEKIKSHTPTLPKYK